MKNMVTLALLSLLSGSAVYAMESGPPPGPPAKQAPSKKKAFYQIFSNIDTVTLAELQEYCQTSFGGNREEFGRFEDHGNFTLFHHSARSKNPDRLAIVTFFVEQCKLDPMDKGNASISPYACARVSGNDDLMQYFESLNPPAQSASESSEEVLESSEVVDPDQEVRSQLQDAFNEGDELVRACQQNFGKANYQEYLNALKAWHEKNPHVDILGAEDQHGVSYEEFLKGEQQPYAKDVLNILVSPEPIDPHQKELQPEAAFQVAFIEGNNLVQICGKNFGKANYQDSLDALKAWRERNPHVDILGAKNQHGVSYEESLRGDQQPYVKDVLNILDPAQQADEQDDQFQADGDALVAAVEAVLADPDDFAKQRTAAKILKGDIDSSETHDWGDLGELTLEERLDVACQEGGLQKNAAKGLRGLFKKHSPEQPAPDQPVPGQQNPNPNPGPLPPNLGQQPPRQNPNQGQQPPAPVPGQQNQNANPGPQQPAPVPGLQPQNPNPGPQQPAPAPGQQPQNPPFIPPIKKGNSLITTQRVLFGLFATGVAALLYNYYVSGLAQDAQNIPEVN